MFSTSGQEHSYEDKVVTLFSLSNDICLFYCSPIVAYHNMDVRGNRVVRLRVFGGHRLKQIGYSSLTATQNVMQLKLEVDQQ